MYSRKQEEVEVYPNPDLVARLRDKLIEFFNSLADVLDSSTAVSLSDCIRVLEDLRGRIVSPSWRPRRVGVVDGGSSILSLSAGYVGVVASIGVVIDGDRVVEKVVSEPIVFPETPKELVNYYDEEVVDSVVDKLRESLVFETSVELLKRGVDLLIVDGPVAPYAALGRIVAEERIEKEALMRYREAVLKLHREAHSYGVDVVGFVKRPRSRSLKRLTETCRSEVFDHVALSVLLKDGEYFPEPPRTVSPEEVKGRPQLAELIEMLAPKHVYVRFTASTPPFRVECCTLRNSYSDILGFLYEARTRDGVPYPVMKADEEVKMSRKLIKELYEDVLHEYIVRYGVRDLKYLAPVLPEYGGV